MYSVVIIDDESVACNIIKNFIQMHISDFFVSASFLNPTEALSYLLTHKTDVIITDIKMPGMDGIELTHQLRDNDVKSKIILLSGYDDFAYAKKAIEYGVFSYILKPIDFSELASSFYKIREILDDSKGKDDIDNFMLRVFTDNASDENALKEELLNLNTPFSTEVFKGSIIYLKIEHYQEYIKQKWNYDSDKMDEAILNILKLSVPDSFVFQLSGDANTLMFVIICQDNQNLLQKVRIALKSTLPFVHQLHVIHTFSNFDEALKFAKFDETELKQKKPDIDDELIIAIKTYLKENYNKNIYLSEIGAMFNMNSVYLSRMFKNHTGVSLHEYHLDERMTKAIDLLMSGNKIEYISRALGYSDRRCFFRNFKKYTGYSPIEYKEMMLKFNDE